MRAFCSWPAPRYVTTNEEANFDTTDTLKMPARSETAAWLPLVGTALNLAAPAFKLILEGLFSFSDNLSARTTSVKIADRVEKAMTNTVLRFTNKFLLVSAKIGETRA
jgi:hypothetical protein